MQTNRTLFNHFAPVCLSCYLEGPYLIERGWFRSFSHSSLCQKICQLWKEHLPTGNSTEATDLLCSQDIKQPSDDGFWPPLNWELDWISSENFSLKGSISLCQSVTSIIHFSLVHLVHEFLLEYNSTSPCSWTEKGCRELELFLRIVHSLCRLDVVESREECRIRVIKTSYTTNESISFVANCFGLHRNVQNKHNLKLLFVLCLLINCLSLNVKV